MSLIIERKDERKLSKAEAVKKLEEQREKDHELVTGLFKFDEHKGGSLHFRFKKHRGDPYTQYEFKDGQRYRIPRMVAVHINTNVHYLKYNHVPGDGVMQMGASAGQSRYSDGIASNNRPMYSVEKVKRAQFIPLEFNSDDLGLDSSNIIQVATR